VIQSRRLLDGRFSVRLCSFSFSGISVSRSQLRLVGTLAKCEEVV